MSVESQYVRQRTFFGRPVGRLSVVERPIVGRDPQREVQNDDSFYPQLNSRFARPVTAEFVGSTLYLREANMRMSEAPETFKIGSRLRPLTRIVGWAVTQVGRQG